MRSLRGTLSAALLGALLLSTAGPAGANDSDLWQKSTLNQILKRGELRVGLEPGYVPFEMRTKKGDLVGFDVELAKQMADAMGVKLKLVAVDWSGILPALLAEQFDIVMSGMTITPERNLWVNFSDSYMTAGQTILMQGALNGVIKSFKDLNKPQYTIVTKPGTTALKAIKEHMPKAKIQLMESEAGAVNEVVAGRVDAFVYDLPFNAIYFARNKKKLAFLDQPFTHERLGWAIRKGDPDFLNWLNHFLAQSKADGTYDALYQRWFRDGAWIDAVE